MAKPTFAKLREIGHWIANPPPNVGELLSLLNYVGCNLKQVSQKPSKHILAVLKPTIRALIADQLFKHADVDVRVAVAFCIVELIRITAPYGPYGDEQMKKVFQLIVSSSENLWDISSRSFKKRVYILRVVAKYRACELMLDLDCDSLIFQMFQNFLNEIRDHHPYYLFVAMSDIMITVLQESDEISSELLSLLLAAMKKNNEEVQLMAKYLVEEVLQKTSNIIKSELLQAVMASGLSINDYNEIVSGICHEEPGAGQQHQRDVATASNQQIITSDKKATTRISDEKLPLTVQKSHEGSGMNISKMTLKETGTEKKSNAQTSSPKIVENRSNNVGSLLRSVNRLHEKPYRKAEIPKKKQGLNANAEFQPISEAAGGLERIQHKGFIEKPTFGNSDEELQLSEEMSTKEYGSNNSEMIREESGAKRVMSNAQGSSLDIDKNWSTDVGSLVQHENPQHGKPYRNIRLQEKNDSLEMSAVLSSGEFQKIPEAAGDSERRTHGGSNGKETSGISDEELKLIVPIPNKDSGMGDSEMTLKEMGTMGQESTAHVSSFQIVENQSTYVGSLFLIENLIQENPYKNAKPPMQKEGLKLSAAHRSVELKKISEPAGDSERRMHVGSNDKATSGASNEDQPLTVKLSDKNICTYDADITLEETAIKSNAKRSFAMESREDEKGLCKDVKKDPSNSATKCHEKSMAKYHKEIILSPNSSRKLYKAKHHKENSGSNSKRKRMRESDRVSNFKKYGAELVNRRVKVLWPLDKMFYRGVVESYDPVNNNHKVLYDDGDVEILYMQGETWEFIEIECESNETITSDKEATSRISDRELPLTLQMATKGTDMCDSEMILKERGTKDKESDALISSFKIVVNQDTNVGSLLPDENFPQKTYRKVEPSKEKEGLKISRVHANSDFLKIPESEGGSELRVQRASKEKSTSEISDEQLLFTLQMSNKGSGTSDLEMKLKEWRTGVEESNAQISTFDVVENQSTDAVSLFQDENLIHEKIHRKVGSPEKKKGHRMSPVLPNAEWEKITEAAGDLVRSMRRDSNGKATSAIADKELPLTVSILDNESDTGNSEMALKETGLKNTGTSDCDAEITLKETTMKSNATRSLAVENIEGEKGLSKDDKRDALDSATKFHNKSIAKDNKEKIYLPSSPKRSSKAEYQEENSGMNTKRKRARGGDSVSNIKIYGAELVHSRIKVLWPLEKTFYKGVVESYDPEANKHKVLYDDGDVEILDMQNEIWEFVDSESESIEEEAADRPASDASSELPAEKTLIRASTSCKPENAVSNFMRKRMRVGDRESKVNSWGVDLLHRRVKVWWPLDKEFYEGIVDSYDPLKNKHRILYDDGDVEVLNMKNQKWEFT